MEDFWSPVASAENYPFEGVVIIIGRAHIWQVGEASGQTLLPDLVMEIRYHELDTGWRIRICKTPQAYWSPVVDPDDVIGSTRLTTWVFGKMKRFVELIAEIYFWKRTSL